MSRSIVFTVLLAVLAGPPLAAQFAKKHLAGGTAVGVTVDRFSFDGGDLTMATLHVSSLKQNAFTPEFAVGVFPAALGTGLMVTAVDVGGARNLSHLGGTLLLRAGASGVFAFGGGGGMALPALHAGAGVLLAVAPQTAIRLDFIHRSFLIPFAGLLPTFSVGVGISGLPRP